MSMLVEEAPVVAAQVGAGAEAPLADAPFFCVTHLAPPWPLPGFMTMVGTGEYRPEGGLAVADLSPELTHENRFLGEYAALFALRRHLLPQRPQGLIGLAHYRRFVLRRPVGRPDMLNHVASPADLASVPAADFLGDGRTPMLSAVFEMRGTMLQQYARCHVASDLLHFFAAAVELGVLDGDAAAACLTGNRLMPAPSVGRMPADWFFDTVGAVETVALHVRRHHFVERDAYQKRSLGFCCERLHGWLLMQRAVQWGLDRVVMQPQVVVSLDGVARPTV